MIDLDEVYDELERQCIGYSANAGDILTEGRMEDPIDDDVGTVDVHYSYSDGDGDDDTGYIVQYADGYEVQSDLHCAQGKTLEELKANFETEVSSNLDYDVEDVSFDWNIEEELQESKKKDMFSKGKSESWFKKNRITEDSLDDFDVDGKIAAANKVAMSDEKLQSAIKSIKKQYSNYLYKAVSRLFSSYDLQEVNKEFLKPGEFKCFISSNMFGGSSRVGSTFYVVFEIGDKYHGALPEHAKLDYNEKRAAVQQFAKELQDEINEIIDEAKAKGFAVRRLQGYGDVFVRGVSQMGSECIEIRISCKITQEEVNSLMENVKTKSKKISEVKHKDKEEREARYAAQAAKFAKDTKFLQDAAKTAKVVIDEIEGYSRPDDWSVILDTEDDYKANAFRNAVGDLLEGTENAYGASYDDIPGMGSIYLGCIQYYEWSEMNGGDVYDDLDESIREKYVVFACSKKKWIDYRRRTDW